MTQSPQGEFQCPQCGWREFRCPKCGCEDWLVGGPSEIVCGSSDCNWSGTRGEVIAARMGKEGCEFLEWHVITEVAHGIREPADVFEYEEAAQIAISERDYQKPEIWNVRLSIDFDNLKQQLAEAREELAAANQLISDEPRTKTQLPPFAQRLWEACNTLIEKAEFKYVFRHLEEVEQQLAAVTARADRLAAEGEATRKLLERLELYMIAAIGDMQERGEGHNCEDYELMAIRKALAALDAAKGGAGEGAGR